MAYSYYADITIDNTKVSGSTDLTNFILFVTGTYDGTGGEPDLRTSANGGEIQNTDSSGGIYGNETVPADIAFYDTTALGTQYDHHIYEYSASTGLFKAWVRVPTVEYDADTSLVMVYGDSGVTTSQENITGCYTDYDGVYALTKTGTQTDGTSNSYDLTEEGTPVTSTGHLHSSAIDFDGSTDSYYIDIASASNLNGTGSHSASFWCQSDNVGTYQYAVSMGLDSNVDYHIYGGHRSDAVPLNRTEGQTSGTIPSAMSGSAWYYYTYDYDAVGDYIYCYIYKASDSSVLSDSKDNSGMTKVALTTTRRGGGGNSRFNVGVVWNNQYYQRWNGEMEMLRVSTNQSFWRTADHHQTEFNNQNAPSTFYTMGAETAAGGGGIAASKRIIQA